MPSDPDELSRILDVNRQIFSFLVGLCTGSFLNVVIARVPEGLSIVRPGSRCPRCLNPIAWYDNIPVLAWVLLLGKCRHCKLPISPRYPIVELLVGLLALAVERRFGVTPIGAGYFAFVCILVAVAYIDLDHWIIPIDIVLMGICLGIVTLTFFDPQQRWKDALIGAAGGYAVFRATGALGTVVFKKSALGAGDWWLIAMIGAYLGWQGLLPVILLASLQGTLVAVILMVAGRNETGPAPAPVPTPDEAATPASPEAPSEKEEEEQPDKPWMAGLRGGLLTGGCAGLALGLGFGVMVGLIAGVAAGLIIGLASAYAAGQLDLPDDDSEDWEPPRNAVPFGPFLALGALQQLFLGDWLRDLYWHIMSGLMK